MRPLRLVLDGFGSFRERTEIDVSDVDFFVLTGPTGSGKSTVIDGLCFALYGTVPRWGKDNVIRNALAPSVGRCEVCLVFEQAGARYVAVRQLRRTPRGDVQTREARLERLDAAVPPDADLATVLGASVEKIATGPDGVTAAATALLGIGYGHFTQCVLLPQGRFAEFLHAQPGERQKLLVELLAYGVYGQVGARARKLADEAAGRLASAQERLAGLAGATEPAIEAAQRRVGALDELVDRVGAAVAEITKRRAEASEQAGRAASLTTEARRLAGLRVPREVPELAARLTEADELVARRGGELARLDAAADEAERHCAALLDRSVLAGWGDAHRRAAELASRVDAGRQALEAAEAVEGAAASQARAAEQATAGAIAALAAAEQAHRAAALAADLRPGQPCPVCRQAVTAVPHHETPADLAAARAAVDRARAAETRARARHTEAGKRAAAARATVGQLDQRIVEATAALTGAPPPEEVHALLAGRDAADKAFTQARTAARAGKDALTAAERQRDSLREAEHAAWSELREAERTAWSVSREAERTAWSVSREAERTAWSASREAERAAWSELRGVERAVWSASREVRDGSAALGPPTVDGLDLAAAWRALHGWAAERHRGLVDEASELDAAARELGGQADAAAKALVAELGEHGVPVTDVQQAPVELATRREGARRDLEALRERHAQRLALERDIDTLTERRQVADLLGTVLRSDRFQRWLCAEALDSLMVEASATLMQLSGGQFELDRDRGEIVVVDHNDAGEQRPVSTLSGGETFQASLALALALSHQVVELSGGRRPLGSMFLDEGFGTLDESTLDTVASTLERLAADTDRMVGIVTHVPALAERVPVQFAITRDGASSHIRRVADVMVAS